MRPGQNSHLLISRDLNKAPELPGSLVLCYQSIQKSLDTSNSKFPSASAERMKNHTAEVVEHQLPKNSYFRNSDWSCKIISSVIFLFQRWKDSPELTHDIDWIGPCPKLDMSLPLYDSIYLDGGDIGALLGPYLDLPSILSLLLANREAYDAFSAFLWNDPMKWIVTTRYPFSSTVRLMAIARVARKSTRDLVFRLDLRALQVLSQSFEHRQDFNKFETTISYDWIARYQTMFANLRFVILNGLRAGEEASLELGYLTNTQPVETFRPLVLSCPGVCVDATETLVTSTSENLMFLDISNTARPDQWTRMMQEASFRNLRIIKISGMRLTQRMFPYHLLTRNALKLWSLDVRDNLLGDDFIAVILKQAGIAAPDPSLHPTEQSVYHAEDGDLYDNVPLYTRDENEALRSPYNTLVPFRKDDLDGFTSYLHSNGDMVTDPRHALPRDDVYVRPTGLTHIYLSNNKLSSVAIHELFACENSRLQVLDVGSLQVPSKDAGSVDHSSLRFQNCVSFATINCAKYFKRETGTRIEKLRIHHSFLTLVPTVVQATLKQGYRLDKLEQAEMLSDANPKLWGSAFQPHDNYRISELTLTDIPSQSYGPIIKRLIRFLILCYDQEVILDKARRDPSQQNYRAPPLLSGIRLLKLEFLHPRLEPIDTTVSSVSNPNSISVSGDKDADAFLSSAAGDFSFFSPSTERPALARSQSLRHSGEQRNRTVSQAKLGKSHTGTSVDEELRRLEIAGEDGRKGKVGQLNWPINSHEEGKGKDRARVNANVGRLSEEDREVWPKDVIEELKRFRRIRPRWSGQLLIERPRGTGEGDGLMGWR